MGAEKQGPKPLHAVATHYAGRYGIGYSPPPMHDVPEHQLREAAQAYGRARHMPSHPAVKASYDALKKEVLQQYQHLKEHGYTFHLDPSVSAGEGADADVRQNKHLNVFSGGQPPQDHPLSEPLPFQDSLGNYNNVFRAVHDVLGHGLSSEYAGHPSWTFDAQGEDRAYRAQAALHSPLARHALAIETRGQNATFNYGPDEEHNKLHPQAPKFAEQKAGLLPKKHSQFGLQKDEKQPELDSEPPAEAKKHPIFSGGTFGIATGQKPKFESAVQGENEGLKQHLKKLGLHHEQVQGHYEQPEESFVVHNPTRAQMYELGKLFGQESVIYSQSGRHQLVYTNGPQEGQYVESAEPHMQYFAEKPNDYFSAVPGGPGFFRMNFDFANPRPLEIHAPEKPNLHPDPQEQARKNEMATDSKVIIGGTFVTMPELKVALLDRLKKTEAHLIDMYRRELEADGKAVDELLAKSEKCGEKKGDHVCGREPNHEGHHRHRGPSGTYTWNTPVKKAEGCPKCGEDHKGVDHATAVLMGPEPKVLHPSDKKVKKAEPLPGQNPSLPNPVQPDLNAVPQSPVGAGNQVPTGQLGPEGQAEMETGGGMCPLCNQPDMPGKCTCLNSGMQQPVQASAQQQPLAMSEKLGKVAPPGREEQVKALKPKVGTESAFKIAWSSYDKRAKKAKKSQDERLDLKKGEAPIGSEGLVNLHEVQKSMVGPGATQGISGGGGGAKPPMMKADLCKACGQVQKMCKCVAKADFVDPKGKIVENDVVGKRPPAASGIREIKNPGNGSVSTPKNASKLQAAGTAAAKKAEPPMAKPPSGKNPATMTPVAKPMGKAALPANPAAQMQQHALHAGSKAAVAAPAVTPAAAARPLQHPANMGRANAMQSALQGAFQPKGPVSSGLELARPPKIAAAGAGLKPPRPPMGSTLKSERDVQEVLCPFCGRADHFGDCK